MRIVKAFLFVLLFSSAGCVDKYFYYPNKVVYFTPFVDRYHYEEVTFNSEDGTKLTGWFIPAEDDALGTVIHFHGNAQNMSAHYPFVSFLPKKGFNVFMFDYRGYGKSEGEPTRRGVYEDSVAAIKHVQSRNDIDRNKIIILGQSLGGANAIAAVGNNSFTGIRGMIIDSTFFSYKGIVKDVIKETPLSSSASSADLSVKDIYSPSLVVQKISPVPILFIHGTADRVIPYSHSKKLYAKAQEPKMLWLIKGGNHIEALSKYRDEVIPQLQRFMLKCVQE